MLPLKYESCAGLFFHFYVLLRYCLCFARNLLCDKRHKKKHLKFLELFFYVENTTSLHSDTDSLPRTIARSPLHNLQDFFVGCYAEFFFPLSVFSVSSISA